MELEEIRSLQKDGSMLERWINRHWTVFSLIILTLTAGWVWFTRPIGVQTSLPEPAPQEGFAAPAFTLNNFAGQAVNLNDFKGKVVLVNFWASWCPPCRAEMQAMQKTYAALGDQGLVILAINTTYQDELKAAVQFAQSEGLTFPLLSDADGAVSRLYLIHAMPTSFFIDRQGKIKQVITGGPMPEALIRTQTETLLKENP
jgi:cytochrome c biogenesis protein CcmG, thiol:disulfide interchange protein DsbE